MGLCGRRCRAPCKRRSCPHILGSAGASGDRSHPRLPEGPGRFPPVGARETRLLVLFSSEPPGPNPLQHLDKNKCGVFVQFCLSCGFYVMVLPRATRFLMTFVHVVSKQSLSMTLPLPSFAMGDACWQQLKTKTKKLNY